MKKRSAFTFSSPKDTEFPPKTTPEECATFYTHIFRRSIQLAFTLTIDT